MPAISYTIAGRFFATQKELTAYVSDLLRKTMPPMRLTGNDAEFMRELLSRHPSVDQKIGCGIASIWVKYTHPFGKGFFIERVDGTFIDFSYKHCIRPFTQASNAKAAFRRALEAQVLAAKQAAFHDSDWITCPVNMTPIAWEHAHVDHEPPRTFAALLAEYCTLRGIDLDTIELYEPKSGIGKLLPPSIEADWAEWHRVHAQLRVISAEANSKLVR